MRIAKNESDASASRSLSRYAALSPIASERQLFRGDGRLDDCGEPAPSIFVVSGGEEEFCCSCRRNMRVRVVSPCPSEERGRLPAFGAHDSAFAKPGCGC